MTSIFLSHKDTTSLINTFNTELTHVSSWLNANRLTLHPEKTKFIIFHPARKKRDLPEASITINGLPVSRVEKIKYLGL